MELGVLGPLQVRQHGLPVAVPGAKPRAILTMLGLHGGSVVSADTLAELLWGARPPRTAAKALQTHISSLRRALGDGFVLTEGSGWTLSTTDIDATRHKVAARLGRDAIAAGDAGQAVARFDEALALWRGVPELPDGPRADSERTRWIEGHAALVEDRADALLATGRAAEIIGELEAAIADAPLRERRWGQLMLALYRAGRQGEALAAFQRARSLLADELGVDPGPNLRRLEAAIVAQDPALEIPVSQQLSAVTKAVTFLLTDIEGSTAAWEAQPDAMAVALARHDEIVEQVVTSRGGRLVKTRGEGDATFSVFDRPSAAAAAAIQLQEAIGHEPWALAQPMRVRVALHTGEVELRDGDYFGRAVNRAARLRSLAAGGQILCSGATAELVIDTLADDVVLADLGIRQLRNLARPEHVFELRLEAADDAPAQPSEPPIQRPALPAVLTGAGPFVGRGRELAGLLAAWQSTLAVGTQAVLVAGEPGVGKTRLAGEWSRQAYEQGAVVLYGRCDEDLGAAYQPFAEALRSLVPCLGAKRLRALRGVEALLPLVPGLTEVVPDLPTPPRSDPDTERYALFDAVVALVAAASASAPVVLILDDLHWAAKPTLLLLRHLLRFGEHARVQIVGTYRSTDLDRSHPLAAMLADLHRDGSATRLALGGLDEDDVTAYVVEAGYDDEELARALASVTGGNPFFLIEALRHVDESGGRWDPSTLPQGVREAVSRRLSRLPEETNKALAAAAVVGSRFPLALVESVVGTDLIDAFDEACKAGIVIEEPGGRYRFNHALVRQSLLAELASVRRMRLHQKIAATLEAEAGADDDELLAELAYHYFECAWAGNAAKAVEYCRRAADQAMARLAYEGAADLFDKALHALEELDEELPDRVALQAELLVARCEALLAAGDVVSAAGAVAQLQRAAGDSVRLAAWGTCFDGELSMLTEPERLDEIEAAVAAAAEKLAGLEDAAGEAKAHTVRAMCLARLGRIGDAETALDQALTAARRAHEHRRVNAVLAGAPLAALWGPNPVPRAGGRCLDVVRLLRITTGSPVVEATSTRCQGVLDALRGRAAAGRALIDSARRSLTELGMRHALLEVDQFAGIVELVADDPAAAEPLLRRAYDGFRRMGLDADTAETAALLARACLALDRDAEADDLCSESERLAGHALKPSIAWRTVRAQLLARSGAHDEANRVAQEAVAVAERTDLLVDHGDACLALATVLTIAGDAAGARAAAERAAELYELKGAAALAEKAHRVVGPRTSPTPSVPDTSVVELENECVRALRRVDAAVQNSDRAAMEREYAPLGSIESRRKIVGFTRVEYRPHEFISEAETFARGLHVTRSRRSVLAVRGERLALSRLEVGTTDVSPGAPQDEWLQVVGLDEDGRIAVQVWFDVEDLEAAMAELGAMHADVELENECVRVLRRVEDAVSRRALSDVEREHARIGSIESRRKIVGFQRMDLPASEMATGADRFIRDMHAVPGRRTVIAIRGERLALTRTVVRTADGTAGAPQDEMLQLVGLDEGGRIALQIWFDVEDMDAAMAEMEATHARFEAGRSTTWLENAASRVEGQCYTLFAQGRADEIEALLAADHFNEDRRQGLRRATHDRAAAMENIRAIADLGVEATSVPIALRGNRLCLSRIQWEQRQAGPNPFTAETLELSEVDAEGLETTRVVFDPDDFDAAFAELDSRYLAGEAARHAHTWSVIAGTFAAVSHDEVPPMSPDCVTLDHRRTRNFAPGDLEAYVQAGHDLDQHIKAHVQVVHRLNDFGAVVGYVAYTRSREGFDAEWREVSLSMVDGGMVVRCELFEEADLETALAKFDALTRSTPQLENAATRVNSRFDTCLAARDWEAMTAVVAEDMCHDDRRRVVGAGIRRGRNAEISDMQAIAELGVVSAKSAVVATRGERLALFHTRFSGREQAPEAFHTDIVDILEINDEDQITRRIAFDIDDLDSAFNELDALYLAGEAAAHASTWSVVVGVFAALARHEMPDAAPDWTSVDHRRGTPLADADLRKTVSTLNDLTPNLTNHVESVHALRDHAVLVTQVSRGTSPEGFDAEWRMLNLMTVDGDKASRCELFDETDLEAALARFDELTRPATRLENAATRVSDRIAALFEARDWHAIAAIHADEAYADDRRHVVSGGTRRGRDGEVENLRVMADLGAPRLDATVLAIRGRRLALFRTHVGDDKRADVSFLTVMDVNAEDQVVGVVSFDPDDVDAAFEELDARYAAGEAAPYAQAWSVLTQGYAAVRRHELPAWTPDAVNVDHRRGAAFAPGELSPYVREMWHQTPDVSIYIEAVHRLTHLGAVVTHVAKGTSQHGFEGEWREVTVTTIDGDRIKHSELFDEKDLDAALVRFDELCRPATRLTNTAGRVESRCQAHIAAGNWDAVASVMADDIVIDDRRRVVNAGLRRGRSAVVDDLRVGAEIGLTEIAPTAIATRGEHLTLSHIRYGGGAQRPEASLIELVQLVEIDEEERIAALVLFDPEDIHAAFEELDARYLAGEAAAHSQTWSVIADAFAAVNRRELPLTAPNFVSLDHRHPLAFAPGEMMPYLQASLNDSPDLRIDIRAVHRLTDLGAVVSHSWHNTSQQGFDAEWGVIGVSTVDGDRINRCELFDESELDTALARFDELSRPKPPMENAASQLGARFRASFAARDWDAMAEMLADDLQNEDRRRVVNGGIRHGKYSLLHDMRSAASFGIQEFATDVIATRGERLVLARAESRYEARPGAFYVENVVLGEIDGDGRMTAQIIFDVDDIDAAFEELDARYLTGEAAPYADIWSVIAAGYATLNRHELPPTPSDFVSLDHRKGGGTFAVGDLLPFIHASWEDTPDNKIRVEVVYRLNMFGAVVTSATQGTSRTGFAAEWRQIDLVTVDRGMINRTELFDEADLYAALAKFDELSGPARLENTASRAEARALACFATRDWASMAEYLAEDLSLDDRRRIVNAGTRRGRSAAIADARAVAELGGTEITSDVIATRGDRLFLARSHLSSRGQGSETFSTESLCVAMSDDDGRITARVVFDPDDIDTAIAELDARYMAGEAMPYARVWSIIAGANAALNRQELAATSPDWVYIDHHRPALWEGDFAANMHAAWEVVPDWRVDIVAVHRLTRIGAVLTCVAHGTSRQGFGAEQPGVSLLTVRDDAINRFEFFDDADLDDALAKFDELSGQTGRPQNMASRLHVRLNAAFAARDWIGMAELLADDTSTDDRRSIVGLGLRRGRDAAIRDWRAIADVGVKDITATVIATRGEHLVLSRYRFGGHDQGPEAYRTEVLGIVEVDGEQRITACVMFDLDEINTAFEELNARYAAGEAASHAHTWTLATKIFAAMNRSELPAATPDWVVEDHRRLPMIQDASRDAYLAAAIEVPRTAVYIESVHRLGNSAALLSWQGDWTTPDGFDAQWRGISLTIFDGDLIDRVEIFDEDELDAALARFDELTVPASQLANMASRVADKYEESLAARDWTAMADVLAEDIVAIDRRRVVNAGVRRGRDVQIADMQAAVEVGFEHMTFGLISTRGERLVLKRVCTRNRGQLPGEVSAEMLGIIEIDADNRITATVAFDLADIDAAFAELDDRYVAGEAAAHAEVWSVVADVYAALNRRELPATTRDWVNVDHRPGVSIPAGEMTAFLHAAGELTPDARIHIEAVHRVTDLGAVLTQVHRCTSSDGFEGEWRDVVVFAVDGDVISRVEIYDETDVNDALARLEELTPTAPQLNNSAIRGDTQAADAFNTRDLDGYLAAFDRNARYEDRRKGLRNEGPVDRELAHGLLFTGTPTWRVEIAPVAIRGPHLALVRHICRDNGEADRPVVAEVLALVEATEDELICRSTLFDPEDIDAAFAELHTRWIASGESTHTEVVDAVQTAHLETFAPLLKNAVARILTRVVDAFGRRDPDGYLALFAKDCMYEDRRKGLRDAGSIRPEYAHTVTFGAAAGWRAEFEPIAVRGEHLMLSRVTFRDLSEAGSPIAVEALNLGSLDNDELISWFAIFDPEDIDAAFDELDARWIASGEVDHPEVIESMRQVIECANRQDWDTLAARESGATFVNHRQLGTGDKIGDHWTSLRAMASLIPDIRVDVADIPKHSAKGVVISVVVRGATVEGTAIELPTVILLHFDGPRVTRMEAFDHNQRDQALARFDELDHIGAT
ncbi:BTAD domain-containing putative transcriptional regulator [Mycobacterium barrassiae]|nr:BTAD domain-containing putative transcriptional regulator [Mycobacterium barrassiae]